MSSGARVLKAEKLSFWKKFRNLIRVHLPDGIETPESPQEAMEMGYRLGIQTGYREGLVDGVDLGMDVGVDIVAGVSRPLDRMN